MLPEEWEACLDAWISLAEAHLSLPTPDFTRISAKDDSLPVFLKSYFAETALSHDGSSTGSLQKMKQLRKQAYILYHRLLNVEKITEALIQWEILADFSKVYGKEKASKVIILAWDKHGPATESSLSSIKNLLIKELDAGLKGDLKNAEANLKRLNHLLHTSPDAAAFFMAGDDFVDALISCYKLMNPPLRKVIITTTYLCIIGLTEGPKPKFSSLVDQLYSLKAAAEAHKKGPTNVNDSMVAELVTVTPILKQIQQRIDASGSGSSRAKSVITSLQGFIKPGGSNRPPRSVKKKASKGKGPANADGIVDRNIHVHQMSLISQVQDLFPDLGSGFIVKLLDAYNDNAEEVIAHLLDDSLPADLANADRSEEMYVMRVLQIKKLTSPLGRYLRSNTMQIWRRIPLRPNFQPAVTFSTMTSWTNLQLTLLAFISVAAIRIKQLTMFLKTGRPRPTKQRFSPPSQHLIPTTTSVTIHTMSPM
jgi:activating signal cointegrator complex subunit 2